MGTLILCQMCIPPRQPDPGAEEPTLPQLWEELEEQMEAEARALVEVRQAVEETEAVKEARVAEEERATLLPGIFDTTSNATVQQILMEVTGVIAE